MPDEEQQSLEDALSETWTQAEEAAAEEAPAAESKDEAETGAEEEDAVVEAASEEDTTGEDEEATGEQETDSEGEEAEEETVAAPEHWSEADKAEFDALPDEVKPLWLEKSKSLEAGYKEKFEAVANDRKELDKYRGFNDLFKPFDRDLAAAGITAEQYTRQLVATALQMRQNPEATIRSLAQQYNVDLVGKSDEDADEFADPDVSKLRRKVEDLEAQLQNQGTAAEQASQNQVEQQWSQFAHQKDDNGADANPGVEALRPMIAAYLHNNPPTPGETMQASFKRAYDEVKYTDPEIRKSVLEAESAKRDEERKANVKKAKKAGRVVKPKSSTAAEAPKAAATLKDEVAEQFDRVAAG